VPGDRAQGTWICERAALLALFGSGV